MGHLFNTTKKAVDDRGNNHDAHFDAVSHWFKQHRQHPKGFTMRELNTQALAAVGAGSDTVSCGLQSFVYHMIRHRDAWGRVREEIDAARENGLCQTRVVSFADAQQLPYLQACINEALRVFSPVPMGLARLAPKEGVKIGDRSFPRGTILSASPWVIHHSKELWGADAHEFNPDRWFDDGISAKEKYWIPVSPPRPGVSMSVERRGRS